MSLVCVTLWWVIFICYVCCCFYTYCFAIFECFYLTSRSLFSYLFLIFFFKQKTAYALRISDWSSDVCSSDLNRRRCVRTPDAIRRDADAALNVCKRHSLASLRAVSSSTHCSDKTRWKSCRRCPGDMVSKSASSCWMRWTSRVSIASHRLRSAATMPSSSVIRVLSGAVNVVRRNAHVAAHPAANAIARRPPSAPRKSISIATPSLIYSVPEIGSASCRERVCQYV